MIYYFSGTGNTRWIAEQMGQLCGLPVKRITDCISEAEVVATEQGDKQVLGMAFPIYGWTASGACYGLYSTIAPS